MTGPIILLTCLGISYLLSIGLFAFFMQIGAASEISYGEKPTQLEK